VRCLCTTHRRTVVGEWRRRVCLFGGYIQGFSVYFAKGCEGWVFAGGNGVVCASFGKSVN